MALFQRGDSLFRMLGTQAKPESKPEPAAEPKPVAPAPEVPATPEKPAKRPMHRGVMLGSIMSFVSVAAAAISFPFMQSRRDALGCDALCVGGQTSLRSGLTLVGASLIGRASDQFGRIPMLWIGLAGSLTSLGINISMDSLQGMWLAIVPTALLNHNWSVAKARQRPAASSNPARHNARLRLATPPSPGPRLTPLAHGVSSS
jgi:hypothetical protein